MTENTKSMSRNPPRAERRFNEDREHKGYRILRSVCLGVYAFVGLISMGKLLFSHSASDAVFSFLPPAGRAIQRALYAPAYYFADHPLWNSGTMNLFSVLLAAVGIAGFSVWAFFRAVTGSDHSGNAHYANRVILIRSMVTLMVMVFSLDHAAFYQNGQSLLGALQRFPLEVIASPLAEIRDAFGGRPPAGLFWGAFLLLEAAGMISLILNLTRLLRNRGFLNRVNGRSRKRGSAGNPLLAIASPLGMFLVSLAVWGLLIWLFNLTESAHGLLLSLVSMLILVIAFVGAGAIWGIKAPIAFCRKQNGAYRFVFWIYFLIHLALGITMLSLTNIYSGHDPLLPPGVRELIFPGETQQALQQQMHRVENAFFRNTTFNVVETAFAGTGITMLAGLIGLLYCWFSKCPVCGRYASWEYKTKIGKKLDSNRETRVTRTHAADYLKTRRGEPEEFTSGSMPETALKRGVRYDELRAPGFRIIRGKEAYDETRQDYWKEVYAARRTRKCRYCSGAVNVTDFKTDVTTEIGKAATERKEQDQNYMFTGS